MLNPIPEMVAGRRVTPRGCHLLPTSYHCPPAWMRDASYWMELMQSMYMSWALIITDGDSVLEQCETDNFGKISPVELLLRHGIIPIVRDSTDCLRKNAHYTNRDNMRKLVPIYAEHGMKPFVKVLNEAGNNREWCGGDVPNDWFEISTNYWMEAARQLTDDGCIVGYPDAPSFDLDMNPFIESNGCRDLWENGLAFFASHPYAKGRVPAYPYDDVTQNGTPLTWDEYMGLLDDLAYMTDEHGNILYEDGKPVLNKQWVEEPLELINLRREQLKSPGLTAVQDDTCWRAWERTLWHAKQASLDSSTLPMVLAEGGWAPRDRPGTGPNTDIRMPHTTPKRIAQYTLETLELPDNPYFANCFWLLADGDMTNQYDVGWPYDAWHTWAYEDTWDQETGKQYGRKKPVIWALQNTPPQTGHYDGFRWVKESTCPWTKVRELVEHIEGMLP